MNAAEVQTRLDRHALSDLHIDVAPLPLDEWRALPDRHVGPLERACGFTLATSATHESTYVLIYCPQLVANFIDEAPDVTARLIELVELVIELNVVHADIADVDTRRYRIEDEIYDANPDLLAILSVMQTEALERWLASA